MSKALVAIYILCCTIAASAAACELNTEGTTVASYVVGCPQDVTDHIAREDACNQAAGELAAAPDTNNCSTIACDRQKILDKYADDKQVSGVLTEALTEISETQWKEELENKAMMEKLCQKY